MQRATARAWKPGQTAATELWFVDFTFFSTPSFVFYFEGGTPHRVLLGKGTEPLCIQNSDPFSCHLNKDRGEGRGGRDDLRKEGSKHANRKEIFNPERRREPVQ